MRFFWSGVVFLAFYFICESVANDYSDSMLPSKEMRNRAHRTMRVAGKMRVGKRYRDSEFDEEAPKRKLRMLLRTGKRTQNTPDTIQDSLTSDFKRSRSLLLVPRVGKNDREWKIDAMSKRSDPKATDLWFGPRMGRTSGEPPIEDFPWNYIVLNGNKLSTSPFQSNEPEGQQNDEETTE